MRAKQKIAAIAATVALLGGSTAATVAVAVQAGSGTVAAASPNTMFHT